MKQPRLNAKEREQLTRSIRRLAAEGVSRSEVARQLGLAYSALYEIAEAAGIEFADMRHRNPGRPRGRSRPRPLFEAQLSKPPPKDLVAYYAGAKKGLSRWG